MCKECLSGYDGKPKSLKEGVVGKELVSYFSNLDKVAVWAEFLEYPAKSLDEVNYRITFEDGSVSDYKITFGNSFPFQVLSAKEYNRVI